jgi:transcriptional regulator with XRE-family HTH domain
MTLRIRYWRKQRGWTLKQLSARCGIPFQLLSDYEIGRIDPPSSKLQPIAQALGVQVGDFFPALSPHESNGHPPTPRAALLALPPRRRRGSRAPH